MIYLQKQYESCIAHVIGIITNVDLALASLRDCTVLGPSNVKPALVDVRMLSSVLLVYSEILFSEPV